MSGPKGAPVKGCAVYLNLDKNMEATIMNQHSKYSFLLTACLCVMGLVLSGNAQSQCDSSAPPVLTCQDITVELDDSGIASVFAAAALYSTEAITYLYQDCAGAYENNPSAFVISVEQSTFTCDDIGEPVAVPLIVLMADGLSGPAECTFNVTVTDPLGLCPVVVEGEGEVLPEGEGEVLPEGEGEILPEGEGEVLPEGEGEVLPEGEGEVLPEGEGEVLPEGEGEVLPEGEGEVLPEGEGEELPEGEGEELPEGEGEEPVEGEGEEPVEGEGEEPVEGEGETPVEGEPECTGEFEVPDVVGETLADATAILNANCFVVGAVTEECSDDIPKGCVISQDPAAGAGAIGLSPVDLVISSGRCACCDGFDPLDPTNLFLGGLALLVLIIASIVLSVGGGGGGFIKLPW
jgi:hypothetical protein